MNKIEQHPILEIPKSEKVIFEYNGKKVEGYKGYTIAAALHQAGFPVHSHSLDKRERSLNCGIGKCGACEMLVDGVVRRICITKVDNVKKVEEISRGYFPKATPIDKDQEIKIYKTQVAIIGAGPAGLACREQLNKLNIPNIVIDNNDRVGGQFNMQTHQFFFFEKEQKYGGMRGFDIAKTLAGEDHSGIMLSSTFGTFWMANALPSRTLPTTAFIILTRNIWSWPQVRYHSLRLLRTTTYREFTLPPLCRR